MPALFFSLPFSSAIFSSLPLLLSRLFWAARTWTEREPAPQTRRGLAAAPATATAFSLISSRFPFL
jgi:hypothetical protein